MSNVLIRPRPASAELPTYRALPHNLEAEQALLGAILVNNEACDRVSSFLKAEHFFDPLHGRLYEHAAKLIWAGKRATPITLKTFFQADEPVGELTVPQYLGRLAANATTIINAEDYGRTIYDLAIRRQLIQIGETLVNTAYDAPIDAPPRSADRGHRAASSTSSPRRANTARGFEPFTDRARPTPSTWPPMPTERDGGLSGLATGFADLDQKMGGLQPSDLIIVAGRPSMGKTALATNIAYQRGPQPTGSDPRTETSARRRHRRLLLPRNVGRAARHPRHRRAGLYPVRTHPPWAHRFRASSTASSRSRRSCRNLRSIIDQTGGITVAQLAARARRLKRQRGLGLIVVDYLQLLSGSSRRAAEGRVQEVTEITTGLKALAKELHVPVIALSQLSRQVENREDKRPQLADLRESGSIEQDADVVMFVFREEYYLERRQPRENTEEHKQWQAEMDMVHGQGRGDHRQAASRPDRHGEARLHAGIHPVQQSRRRGAPSGAAGVTGARPPSAARGPGDAGDEATASAILTIDLDALLPIIDAWRALGAPAECAAVVKANAYGLGVAAVAPALARAGCKTFFVATLGEASELRAPPARCDDLRLWWVARRHRALLPPAWLAAGAQQPRGDQGVGCLSVASARAAPCRDPYRQRHEPARPLCRRGRDYCLGGRALVAFELALVMSHLACADEPEHPKSAAQRGPLRRCAAKLPKALASLANSAGILLGRAYHYDLVRPGIALYGGKVQTERREPVCAGPAPRRPHSPSARRGAPERRSDMARLRQ